MDWGVVIPDDLEWPADVQFLVVPVGQTTPTEPFSLSVLRMLNGTTGASVIEAKFATLELSRLRDLAADAGNRMTARSLSSVCDLAQFNAATSVPRSPIGVPVAAGLIQQHPADRATKSLIKETTGDQHHAQANECDDPVRLRQFKCVIDE